MHARFIVAPLVFASWVSCRRQSDAPATPPAPVTAAARAAGMNFPLRPLGCDYDIEAPHAGHLAVTPHVELTRGESHPKHLHLTAVGDPSRSMVAQWNTDPSDRSTLVRVRPFGTLLWRNVEGASFLLPGASHVRHHEAHLCGLRASTAYEYAVGSSESARVWRFRTAPDRPEPVTVMVAGDARTQPEVWGAIATQALREAPEVLLFTGDAVANGASYSLWARFFEAAETLLATTPAYWADGNHEGMSAVYYDQFALPGNGERAHHEHWYAATWGPLRVIALNDVTVASADIEGPQRDFLESELAKVDRARTPWVVTMHHQPMHTDAIGHLPDALTRRVWGPLFDRARVDVDLSGHVHNYESTEAIYSDGTLAPEGLGTRYFVFGGAGAPLYEFHHRAPWVHGRESSHGYGLARVRADRFEWQAHRLDGSLIETVVIPWRPIAPRP